jgi:ribosomal protein S18 acetylase RimI-like enzyme
MLPSRACSIVPVLQCSRCPLLHVARAAVSAGRVTLRPLLEADLPLVEPWYDRSARAAGLHAARWEAELRRHFEEAQSQPGQELQAIVLALRQAQDEAGKGEVIGLLDWRASYPAEGWLAVCFLAVAESYRGRGLGSEAIFALEEDARRRGLARHFTAGVAADAGRALYFWLRLGYRPLLQVDVPWPSSRPGVIWMVRETE